MIITFQYTFTDIRRFDTDFTLLKLPQWPLPNPYKEFVRGKGQVVPRRDKALSTHLGKTSIAETYVCKINKGVKVPKKLKDTQIRNRINHYFSDGGVLSKYEFVFEIAPSGSPYTVTDIKAIVNQILNTAVLVRNAEFKYSSYKFRNIIKGLTELQLISTTERKYIIPDFYKYIIKCTPQIFVTLNHKESFSYKPRIRTPTIVNDSFQSVLYGWWEVYNSNPYKFWVLKNNGRSNNETLNTLKTGILRIHSEKECINNVIQALLVGKLRTPPETDESDFLQRFLNDKIKDLALGYKKIGNLEDSADRIEQFIKEVHEKFNPGEITLLHTRFQQLKFRPQVGDKLLRYTFSNTIHIEKQIIMDNSQSISFGDNANFTGDIHQGITNTQGTMDFKAMYDNIGKLLDQVQSEKESYERAVAVENLNAAREASVRQDSKGVLSSLKKVGQWTLDIASKVGVNFITEMIKKEL